MTLSTRNNVFKLGIAFSSLCLFLCVLASIKVIPIYPSIENEITRTHESFFRTFSDRFPETNLLATHYGILALVFFSFLSIVLSYFSFEKTHSPEILFVVLFAASFSLESLRLIIPLGKIYEIPSLYMLVAARIILFGRYFGLFSLFTASLYAVGFKAQKQRNVLTIIAVITLIIVLGVPIDTQVWDSSLNMITGYTSMFRLIETGALLIITISFFIAAWLRSSQDFVFIGVGAVMVFLGRNILLSAITWIGLPLGILLLAAGTWLICTRLHKIYLWL